MTECERTVSSAVAVTASSTANGASFTALTVMVKRADVRQATVGDGVVDRIDAVEVGGRRVSVTAVRGNRDAAALGRGEGARNDNAERVTVDIGVIGIEVDDRVETNGVSSAVAVTASSIGYRRVVHRVDGDGQACPHRSSDPSVTV